jgi:hypothetical protein
MKYLKYTYVDAITGISIASEPAANGPKPPPVAGLAFAWARESAYPTPVPEFFGTCPDDSPTQADGVLGVYIESDWEQMRQDEMKNRTPQQVTMRQARLALLGAGLLAGVDAAIASLPEPDKSAAQIEWEYAAVVQRGSGLVPAMGAALGMTEAQLDALFITASGL